MLETGFDQFRDIGFESMTIFILEFNPNIIWGDAMEQFPHLKDYVALPSSL